MTKFNSSSQVNAKRMSSSVWQRVTTIGVDLGDRFSRWCALDADGEIVAEDRVSTTAPAMAKLFSLLGRKRIAVETGTHSPWVSRLLESLSHEVIVANSRKLELISRNRQKDDRSDARTLARLARFDMQLLYPVRHRSQTMQAHLELVRARDVLVSVRTKIVNHLRGAAKPFGVRLPRCSPSAMVKKAPAAIPAELQPAMAPLLDVIKTLSMQIAAYDRGIEDLANTEYKESQALRQTDLSRNGSTMSGEPSTQQHDSPGPDDGALRRAEVSHILPRSYSRSASVTYVDAHRVSRSRLWPGTVGPRSALRLSPRTRFVQATPSPLLNAAFECGTGRKSHHE